MTFLNCLSVAFTIIGAFIGAGFVSGQELWQFFGKFGIWGLVGLCVAVALISLLIFIIIKNAVRRGVHSFEALITNKENAVIKKFLVITETVFYMCIYVIMTAGAESLLFETFRVNKTVTGIIFASIVTFISVMGVKWVISAFSATVPILTVSVLAISVFCVAKDGIAVPASENASIFSALFSSIVFVSYNFIAGIGVFASLSRQLKNTKKLKVSVVIAAVFLFIIGGAILISVFSHHGSENSDLPMIAVSLAINNFVGRGYSFLLVLAMLGASLASLFPIAERLRNSRGRQIILCTLISTLCVIFSGFGFKELITTVYPIFGYIGFIIIAMVLVGNFKKEK